MKRKYSNPTAAHCVGSGLVASTQGTLCVDLRLENRLGDLARTQHADPKQTTRERKKLLAPGSPVDKGPFDPCNLACTGWVERDFKSAKKSGSSPDKCPFVRLGRRRLDACLTTWTILLTCHFNAGGPVCPAVVHPAKPQRHRYTLCD
jgi:hypothetical protein